MELEDVKGEAYEDTSRKTLFEYGSIVIISSLETLLLLVGFIDQYPPISIYRIIAFDNTVVYKV
jgi:hypothetical protein